MLVFNFGYRKGHKEDLHVEFKHIFYRKQSILTLLMTTFSLSAFPKTVNSRVTGSEIVFESNYICSDICYFI